MTQDTTPIYKKVGRKYVPIAARWYEEANIEQQAVGAFRLTYAYTNGGRRYAYDVTPATAPMVAAMMIAKVEIEDKLRDLARMRPMGTSIPYTKKQLALIAKFRADMGGMYPSHWTENSAHEISEAAIKAVMEVKP